MMFWYGHDVGGWGWFATSLSMIIFWALIITGIVLLFRSPGRGSDRGDRTGAAPPAERPSAETLLAERFARGEIDEEEFQRRLATLRASGPTK